MSPLGFQTHRQARYEDLPFYGDEDSDFYDLPPRSRPVPIWLCVFLVISYIIAGAFIFHGWEHWPVLDSAYFCFITLTTIGKYGVCGDSLNLTLGRGQVEMMITLGGCGVDSHTLFAKIVTNVRIFRLFNVDAKVSETLFQPKV